MSCDRNQKLSVALAAVAVAGAGALYVGTHPTDGPLPSDNPFILVVPPNGSSSLLPPDILDQHEFAHGPNGEIMPFSDLGQLPSSDPSCKPAAEVADKYKKEGYKGLAYGYSDTGAFFILTDEANKKWAVVTPDDINPANACVKHEGVSFETAQPTGRLLYASAPIGATGAKLVPAVYMTVSDENEIPVGPDGRGDIKPLLQWFNDKVAASTVFKGHEKDGSTLRIVSTKSDVPFWIMLSSDSAGKTSIEDSGQGFQYAQTFKPPMKHLE